MRPQELGVIVDDGSGFFKAAFSEYIVFGLSFYLAALLLLLEHQSVPP